MSKLQKYKCVGCNYETTKAEVASIRCPRCNYKGLTPIPEQTFEEFINHYLGADGEWFIDRARERILQAHQREQLSLISRIEYLLEHHTHTFVDSENMSEDEAVRIERIREVLATEKKKLS